MIHNFVEQRYADFCTSADQHDDHKQTLTELAENAAVVETLKNALIEAQNALGDAVDILRKYDAASEAFKALATIATALKEIDE